eukprot:5136799-Pyramimonas_sp.AAC.1
MGMSSGSTSHGKPLIWVRSGLASREPGVPGTPGVRSTEEGSAALCPFEAATGGGALAAGASSSSEDPGLVGEDSATSQGAAREAAAAPEPTITSSSCAGLASAPAGPGGGVGKLAA